LRSRLPDDGADARALDLAGHGLRLQVPLLVGLVVDPLVPTKEPQESTTVTPAEIIYHRRVQVLDRAGQTSVTEACRTVGVSRTHLLPLGRPRPALWAGRAATQRPPTAGDADRDPSRPGRGGAGRGGGPPHHRGPAPGRPPGRAWGAPVGLGGAEDPAPPPARPALPARGRPRPAHRGHDRHPDHRRQGWPLRLLPLRRPAW
jgi:hypothetical protein